MITGTRLLVCCFIYRLRYNRLPGDQRLTDRDLVIRLLDNLANSLSERCARWDMSMKA